MQHAEKLDLDEEIKQLEKTITRKELSTSTDTQGDVEEQMMRRVAPVQLGKDKVEVG